eukprot:355736-Chlamydomonas_euryale.AAC.13
MRAHAPLPAPQAFAQVNTASPPWSPCAHMPLFMPPPGVFPQVNTASLGLLKYVEPFVAFGYPSLKSVKELVYKRGYAKVNGRRVPLTDNKMIEDKLGKHKIICMEDLVHEIFTVGPAFKEVTSFLWPFKLSSASGGLASKSQHYVESGQAGNRQHEINKLIANMN